MGEIVESIDDTPILAEQIAIRLHFSNEEGINALIASLEDLRSVYFK